jgi:hypothetical protein
MEAFRAELGNLSSGSDGPAGPLGTFNAALLQYQAEVDNLPGLTQVLEVDDLPAEARQRRFREGVAAAEIYLGGDAKFLKPVILLRNVGDMRLERAKDQDPQRKALRAPGTAPPSGTAGLARAIDGWITANWR